MFSDPQKNIEQFNLGKGTSVADFGAGSGFYSFAAAESVGGEGKVYAIDVLKDMLSKLKNEAQRKHLTNIEIVWADIDNLGGTKLKDNSIDSVIAANVFFQLEQKDYTCMEIMRILKNGGKVLLVDWSESFGGTGPQPEHIFTSTEARKLFTKHNFIEEKEIQAGTHHYGIIFRKK